MSATLDRTCAACGAPLEDQQRFCGQCGARVTEVAPGPQLSESEQAEASSVQQEGPAGRPKDEPPPQQGAGPDLPGPPEASTSGDQSKPGAGLLNDAARWYGRQPTNGKIAALGAIVVALLLIAGLIGNAIGGGTTHSRGEQALSNAGVDMSSIVWDYNVTCAQVLQSGDEGLHTLAVHLSEEVNSPEGNRAVVAALETDVTVICDTADPSFAPGSQAVSRAREQTHEGP